MISAARASGRAGLRGPPRTSADLRGPPRTSAGLRGPPRTVADLLRVATPADQGGWHLGTRVHVHKLAPTNQRHCGAPHAPKPQTTAAVAHPRC